MNDYLIISHIRESDFQIQTNDEHQAGVAYLAGIFADSFGMKDIGRVMGLLHDKGKEQLEWQQYIRGVTGYDQRYARGLKPNSLR